ncbi:MAG: 50S ribosomal protein L10 [Acidimicrobiia bacterium]|nr:50S ribosomal protein L10 [Acidimicrobiia bacterium]
MPRPEKVQAVEDIKQRLDAAPAVFLTEYRGLSVPQQEQLRAGLREAGADYKVVKMSLAAIAARDLGLDELADEMVGPTAIAFAGTDAVAAAKALTKFADEHDVFVVKSGMLGGNVLAPEQVGDLAKLPGREELLGKIAGAMAAPLFGAAGMFQAFTRNAAGMMSQLLEKKEEGDPIAGSGGVPAVEEEPEAPAEAAAEETTEEEPEAPAEDTAAEEPTDETTPAEAEADAETDPAAEADDPAAGEEE